MHDLSALARRSLKTLTIAVACITLSACYSCSLNGGWEGQMNPFCVKKDSLIGPISPPAPPALIKEQPPRESSIAMTE
jgi:hypothetical protein